MSDEGRKMSAKVCENYERSIEYTRYRLRHYERSQAEYGRKKLRVVEWHEKTLRRSAEDRLINETLSLSKTSEKILVCFGDGSLADGVSYGRNAKPAVCRPRRAFHRRRDSCDVIDVDEYMTTKKCSRCTTVMNMPVRNTDDDGAGRRRRRNHRFQFCRKCGIAT